MVAGKNIYWVASPGEVKAQLTTELFVLRRLRAGSPRLARLLSVLRKTASIKKIQFRQKPAVLFVTAPRFALAGTQPDVITEIDARRDFTDGVGTNEA